MTSHVSDPMPAAAALAVIDAVEEEGLASRARSRGEYLLAGLRERQQRHEHIGDVRGLGLLCGLELVEDRGTRAPADALGPALTDECQRCGLSINLVREGTGGQARPPAHGAPARVSQDEIDLAVTIMDEALHTVTERRGGRGVQPRPLGGALEGASSYSSRRRTHRTCSPSSLRPIGVRSRRL